MESPTANVYKIAATSHVTKKTYRKVKYIAGHTNLQLYRNLGKCEEANISESSTKTGRDRVKLIYVKIKTITNHNL